MEQQTEFVLPSCLIEKQQLKPQTKGKFRGNWCFATYPQSSTGKKLTKIDVLEHWVKKKNSDWVYVVEETHKNGGKHIHAIARRGKGWNFSLSKKLDINEHHPNVGVVKNKRAAYEYLKKEDKDPLIHGETPNFDEDNPNKKVKILAKEAKKYINFSAFFHENDDTLSMYSVNSYQKGFELSKSLYAEVGLTPESITWEFQKKKYILNWEKKLRHFWIISIPGCGKTHFARNILINQYGADMLYYTNSSFYSKWNPKSKIIVVDDVVEIDMKMILDLSNACHGSSHNVKGGMIDNIETKIVFIFSNYAPNEKTPGGKSCITGFNPDQFNERFCISTVSNVWKSQETAPIMIIDLD